PSLIYDYPLEYLKNFSGSYKISEKGDGSAFGVDSVWLKRESEHFDTVEAHGLVETDYGIYKSIKDKRVEYIVDTIFAKFSVFPGLPAQWNQVDLIYDTLVNYYFHTREGKLPVAEVSTDLQGDLDSTTLIITQATPEPLANFGFEDACVGQVVQFTDSSIQNPSSWQWDFGDGSNGSTQQNPSHTYTSSGQFTVRLIASRNYPDTLEKTITINEVIADAGADEDICPGDTVTLTASGGVGYAWNNNSTDASITVSPSSTSTYSVTVTGATGCTDADQVTVNVLPEPSPALFDAIICNGNPVTLDAENPGATYNWSTTESSQTITVSTPDTYVVTITDPSSGCSITDTAVVTTGSNLNVPLNDVDACEGDTVVLNAANSGADYIWNTGDTTRTISVTLDGSYSVTVDDQSCTGTGTATVTFHANPEPEITGDSVICAGDSTYLFVNTTDNITWSTFSGNDSILVSPGADQYYSVELEDALGCTGTDSILLTVNPLPNAQITGDTEICTGDQTTLTASGGTDYEWSNFETTASIQVSPTSDSTYSVIVTDTNTCSITIQETVVVNALPNASIIGNTEICEGETTTLTASGGTDYEWSNNNETTASIQVNPSSDETYTVIVTDNNTSCSNTAQETVEVNALPNVDFAFGDTTICFDQVSTLALEATPPGGTFSGVGVSGSTLDLTALVDSNLNSSTVFYTYTGSNNCTAEASIDVIYGACPGIEDYRANIDYQLYPNPSSNGFYVKSNIFQDKDITLSLIDLNGKAHVVTRADRSENFISTAELAEGLYFLIGR
ncbi:MAG: PKD domain-containing protein, partial [Chitinophagales bacterium]